MAKNSSDETGKSGIRAKRVVPRTQLRELYLQRQRIERVFLVHQTVRNRLLRVKVLKRSEHPVPNDQNAPVILVQTVQIAT